MPKYEGSVLEEEFLEKKAGTEFVLNAISLLQNAELAVDINPSLYSKVIQRCVSSLRMDIHMCRIFLMLRADVTRQEEVEGKLLLLKELHESVGEDLYNVFPKEDQTRERVRVFLVENGVIEENIP